VAGEDADTTAEIVRASTWLALLSKEYDWPAERRASQALKSLAHRRNLPDGTRPYPRLLCVGGGRAGDGTPIVPHDHYDTKLCEPRA